ncbi:MAG: hypothetical protein ACLFUB_03100 [Cyclobacteriaceae bacterium]
MISFKKTALLLSIFCLMMSACKEELEVTPATYSMLLTGEESKSWRRISRDLIIELGGQRDTISFNRGIPPCQLDDVFIFYREGQIFEIGEGLTTCDEDDENVLARGRWRLNHVNRIIDLGTEVPYTLVSLQDDELIWGYEVEIGLNTGLEVDKEFPAFLMETYVPADN